MIEALSSEMAWPAERLYTAVGQLARAAGLKTGGVTGRDAPGPDPAATHRVLDHWFRAAGRALEVGAEPVNLVAGRLDRALAEAAPVIVRLPQEKADDPAKFITILAVRSEKVILLDRAGRRKTLPLELIMNRLIGRVGLDARSHLQTSLAYVLPDADEALVNRVVADRYENQWVAYGWRLQPAATAPLGQTIRHHRLVGSAVGFGLTHVFIHGLWLFSWFLLGRAILQGSFSTGWFIAWGLARLSIIPLRALNNWFRGHFSIGLGGLLKRRLLGGAFNLDSDLIKQEGIGQLIGRVQEAEALENLLLQGGFLLISGVIETLIAFWLLNQSALPAAFVLLLMGWLIVLTAVSAGYYHTRKDWTAERLVLTHDLTEKMTGHQTRLAQLPLDQWHDEEDKQMSQYGVSIAEMDGWFVWLRPLAVHGWLAAAAALLFFTFENIGSSPGILAVTIGAVLATAVALNKMVQGVSQLIDAWIAKRHIERFLVAEEPQPPPISQPQPAPGTPLVTTHQVSYRYRPHAADVVRGINLKIFPDDRILLESRSGGGKSTLVALLAGLRMPRTGLVLTQGLDIRTHGLESWRRQIAIAPQFHENHIFLGTVAFNLLMGRRWPPTPGDLAEAERMCTAVGLGPLLERMPSGLQQMIGETGWKLSHGERTRIYLARALLQAAPLTILDESFGALDPVTLQQVMDTARAHETALLVIAHP